MVCTLIVCAVKVPRTVKLSADDAVWAKEAVPESKPTNEPVNEDAVTLVATFNEFNTASEPDTITFFQLGIVYNLDQLWLDTYTMPSIYAYFR